MFLSCFFISGQNLASREIQRPGWGGKDIGAQLWALKMISGCILTVLILDFSFAFALERGRLCNGRFIGRALCAVV